MTSIRQLNRLRRLVLDIPLGVALCFGALALSTRVEAQSQPTPLSYTAGQAEQGKAAYAEQCASCHGQSLDDGAYAPALKGADFRRRWGAGTPDALFTYTSTKMPPARPGALGDEIYAQLLAHILGENGAKPGNRELPGNPDALKSMSFVGWPRGGGGGLAPGVVVPPGPVRSNPLDRILR